MNLKSKSIACAAFMIAIAMSLPTFAPNAAAQGVVREVHGEWSIRCDTPAGARTEYCGLSQFVTAEDRENVGLNVTIIRTADGKAQIMRVLAPLGVLLPAGLGLQIDNKQIGAVDFVRCLPNGCVSEVVLDEKLIEGLTTGSTATFIVFQTPEEGIGIPIDLTGFEEGFKALP